MRRYQRATITFALIAGIVTGTANGEQLHGVCSKYENQLSGDPAINARLNANKNDYRFLAVFGFTTEFPGLGTGVYPKHYRIIAGTSDSVADDSCFIFNRSAWRYAERYNKTIVSLRQKRVAR